MMPLPRFELARPGDLAEAVALLAEAGSEGRAVAGGTDLLVNLKSGLATPRLLVAIGDLEQLRAVAPGDAHGSLRIGASERLSTLAASAKVRERAPALAEACAAVGHPQIRRMGTLGGNVCLDTRCRYINRSEFWRSALGGCLKANGDTCHVVAKGKRCVASTCGDTLPALIALGAQAVVVGSDGERTVDVGQLRANDGAAPLALGPGEIVVAFELPAPPTGRHSAYLKWSLRKAVDFPLVSVAVVLDLDDQRCIERLEVACGALGPRPRSMSRALARFLGEPLTTSLAGEVGALVDRTLSPLPNLLGSTEQHRARVAGVLLERQLLQWAEGSAATG